ncbi:MAG: aspartate-alanine antiporter [Muribaculaceae bacterium]|nr:aspartate-alanine antiporter [Muribaculaceae bacterium]
MIDYLFETLQDYPALAIFLTLGLGFLIGKIKIGHFSLGSVTSVLIIGAIIGQIGIPMSGPIKSVFFMLFLFSIGYSVGPDFFRSLRKGGARQALFAILMSSCCFISVLAVALLFKYTKGETVGLFAGSETCSALIGVGIESISKLGLDAERLKNELDIIPVTYAVTYIFGTLGTVIILGNFGPRLLGGYDKVKEQTLELERSLSAAGESKDPATRNALRYVDYRVFRASGEFFSQPRKTTEFEKFLHSNGINCYVDSLRHADKISTPRYYDEINPGDEIVLCGPTESMVKAFHFTGPEVSDAELLSYPIDRVAVVVADKEFINIPLKDIHMKKYMHGVVIRDCYRDGEVIDLYENTLFKKGDRITVLGRPVSVAKATSHIGHVDRPSVASDLMFVGLAVFIGGLFGALSLWIGDVTLSFGTAGGALIAGLFFGWLRSKRPTYGNISPGALWLMNNLGLNVFIAVIALESAPSFISGLKAVGPMLFVAGAIATTIPLLVGLWLGHRVFKFNPAITLGCCAGTRTCTASLGAVQDALGSTVPAIGYTVTYAVANIMLVIWGLLTVMLI